MPQSLGTLADVVVFGTSIGACLLVVKRGGSPSAAAATAVAAYILATQYVMPWYLAWALPVCGTSPR